MELVKNEFEKRLTYLLRSSERTGSIAEDCICRPVANTDLVKILICDLDDGKLFQVPESILKAFNISVSAALEIADENLKKEPYICRPLDEFIKCEFGSEKSISSPLYIVSNENMTTGSRVMLREDVLSRVADEVSDTFYILPSSIHEVLVISAACENPQELAGIVSDVNRTQVSDTDFLSNHVYKYTKEKGIEIYA